MSLSILHKLADSQVSEALLAWVRVLPLRGSQQPEDIVALKDVASLSEILLALDSAYFKDLQGSSFAEKRDLWLGHLIQLKKLFLRLSAYVELYLKQDWSLLPVPDFKAIAKMESAQTDTTALGHLNFMVAAVLLTALHSGAVSTGNGQQIVSHALEMLPKQHQQVIDNIHEWFFEALEPKSSSGLDKVIPTSPKSPRKISVANTFSSSPLAQRRTDPVGVSSPITPRRSDFASVASPMALQSDDEVPSSPTKHRFRAEEEILLSPILMASPTRKPIVRNEPTQTLSANDFGRTFADFEISETLRREHDAIINGSDEERPDAVTRNAVNGEDVAVEGLKKDLEAAQAKLEEYARFEQLYHDREDTYRDIKASLDETLNSLRLADTQCLQLRERLDAAREEKDTLAKTFEVEKNLVTESLGRLARENGVLAERIAELEWLEEAAGRSEDRLKAKEAEIELLSHGMEELRLQEHTLRIELELAKTQPELLALKHDNERLLASLKKARDHILKQHDALQLQAQALSETAALRTELERKEVEIESLKQKIGEMESSKLALETEARQASAPISVEKSEILALQRELTAAQVNFSEERSAVNGLLIDLGSAIHLQHFLQAPAE